MKIWTLVIILLLLAGFVAADSIPQAWATGGHLLNSTTNASLNGTFNVTANLYLTYSGGSSFWQNLTVITTDQYGNFVYLFNTTNFSYTAPIFVGWTVMGDAEIVPRSPVVSVPFALEAQHAINASNLDANSTVFTNCTSNQWAVSIGTGGLGCVQPGFTNISGTVADSQMANAKLNLTDQRYNDTVAINLVSGNLSGNWTIIQGLLTSNTTTNGNLSGNWTALQNVIGNLSGNWTFLQYVNGNLTGNWTYAQNTAGNLSGNWTYAQNTAGNLSGNWTSLQTVIANLAGNLTLISGNFSITNGNLSGNWTAIQNLQGNATANWSIIQGLNTTKSAIGSSAVCTYGIANTTLLANAVPSVTCAAQQGTENGTSLINTIQNTDTYLAVTNGTTATINANLTSFDNRYASNSIIYWLGNTSSDLTNYELMNKTFPVNGSNQTLAWSAVSNGQNLTNWSTPNSLPIPLYIGPGEGYVYIVAAQTAGTATSTLFAQLVDYNTTTNKIVDNISNTSYSLALTSTPTGYYMPYNLTTPFNFSNTTDRVGLQLFANTTGGTAPTIEIYMSNLTYSRLQIPAPIYADSVQAVLASTGLTVTNASNIYTASITNTGVTAGTYGGASTEAVTTYNAQGQATSASNTSIIIPWGNFTGIPSACAAGQAVTNLSTGLCSAFLTTESLWIGNSTLVPYLASNNTFTGASNNFTGNINTTQNVSAETWSVLVQTALTPCNSTVPGQFELLRNGTNGPTTGWYCVENTSNIYNWTFSGLNSS